MQCLHFVYCNYNNGLQPSPDNLLGNCTYMCIIVEQDMRQRDKCTISLDYYITRCSYIVSLAVSKDERSYGKLFACISENQQSDKNIGVFQKMWGRLAWQREERPTSSKPRRITHVRMRVNQVTCVTAGRKNRRIEEWKDGRMEVRVGWWPYSAIKFTWVRLGFVRTQWRG